MGLCQLYSKRCHCCFWWVLVGQSRLIRHSQFICAGQAVDDQRTSMFLPPVVDSVGSTAVKNRVLVDQVVGLPTSYNLQINVNVAIMGTPSSSIVRKLHVAHEEASTQPQRALKRASHARRRRSRLHRTTWILGCGQNRDKLRVVNWPSIDLLFWVEQAGKTRIQSDQSIHGYSRWSISIFRLLASGFCASTIGVKIWQSWEWHVH